VKHRVRPELVELPLLDSLDHRLGCGDLEQRVRLSSLEPVNRLVHLGEAEALADIEQRELAIPWPLDGLLLGPLHQVTDIQVSFE
jgi:hypothetical protein